jgi:hypothetical protein
MKCDPLVQIRLILAFFIVALVLSGVTAFPLQTELDLLARMLGVGDALSPQGYEGLNYWILTVKFGLHNTYAAYPWIAYGTDWLAFGHIVIALFFIGPLIDPVRNLHALYTGVAACVLVLPLALIAGPIRGIPFYWQLIDCSFGILGIFPLLYVIHLTRTRLKPQ